MRGIAILIALAVWAAPAVADDAPWAAGVSDDQKAKAQTLLEQGNAQFVEHRYTDALQTYQAAVAVWDHPAIRFNIVRCLVQLGRTLEAYDNLELALRYGKAPLEESVYEEALGYQKLLEGQIAEVHVRCTQPDVQVALDAKPLFTCPGDTALRVAPGAHVVIAKKDGFLTMTKDVIALPAQRETVDVALLPIETAAITVRRWSLWKPWAVVAAGGAIAIGGGLLEWKASRDYDAYDRAVTTICGEPGCDPGKLPPETAAIADRARTENRFAIATLTISGAAVITGAVLVYLDRSHTEMPTLDLTPTSATASLRFSF
ncbi:MAG TPA: tetratricopeptide repeat protein [Kofleriaceae bacterium]|nr:tetratricopeptide repeat protein [Kofleriaceae bacterium]